MKKIFPAKHAKYAKANLLLACLACLAGSAFSATITGTVTDNSGTLAGSNTFITFEAQRRPYFTTNGVRPGWTIRTNASTNGTFSLTLLAGTYLVQTGPEARDRFYIEVEDSTNTYAIGTITTNAVPILSGFPPTNWAMWPASAATNGRAGLVPAPNATKHTNYLRGDGTWAVVTNLDLGTIPIPRSNTVVVGGSGIYTGAQISNAFRALGSAQNLQIGPGTYTLTVPALQEVGTLWFTNLNDVVIDGFGTVIKATGFGTILRIGSCSNVTIRGITFVGDRTDQQAHNNSSNWFLAAGIFLTGTNKNVTIENCAFLDMPDQGITSLQTGGHALVDGYAVRKCHFANLGCTNMYWGTPIEDGSCISGIYQNAVFSENTADHVTHFIEYEGYQHISAIKARNIRIHQNRVNAFYCYAVLLVQSTADEATFSMSDVIIDGNQFAVDTAYLPASQTFPIRLYGPLTNCIIAGNTFHGGGTNQAWILIDGATYANWAVQSVSVKDNFFSLQTPTYIPSITLSGITDTNYTNLNATFNFSNSPTSGWWTNGSGGFIYFWDLTSYLVGKSGENNNDAYGYYSDTADIGGTWSGYLGAAPAPTATKTVGYYSGNYPYWIWALGHFTWGLQIKGNTFAAEQWRPLVTHGTNAVEFIDNRLFPEPPDPFLVGLNAAGNLTNVLVRGVGTGAPPAIVADGSTWQRLTATKVEGYTRIGGSWRTNGDGSQIISGTIAAARLPVVSEATHATNADVATSANAVAAAVSNAFTLAGAVVAEATHATNADLAARVTDVDGTNLTSGTISAARLPDTYIPTLNGFASNLTVGSAGASSEAFAVYGATGNTEVLTRWLTNNGNQTVAVIDRWGAFWGAGINASNTANLNAGATIKGDATGTNAVTISAAGETLSNAIGGLIFQGGTISNYFNAAQSNITTIIDLTNASTTNFLLTLRTNGGTALTVDAAGKLTANGTVLVNSNATSAGMSQSNNGNLAISGTINASGNVIASGYLQSGGVISGNGTVRAGNYSSFYWNSATTPLIQNSYRALTNATLGRILSVAIATNKAVTLCVDYSISGSDGTNVQVLGGKLWFSCANALGTLTTNIVDSLQVSNMSAGTLSAAFTAVPAANAIALWVTPTTSLSTAMTNFGIYGIVYAIPWGGTLTTP